ncbi:MAG: thioredoxin domain-containing protein [Gammaproteobacteria bacterium]|nr:thioredoxin domain-containing protein [Gammaproteobacteria bacterium]MDH5778658.1 thioredoxin domain-containing protein [Gammaproteobacteria bacterium]
MNDMPALIFDIQYEEFQQRVIEDSAQSIILLDMWADWCPPCLVIGPILEQLVAQYDGEVRLAKLEVDEGENMKIAGQYQVRGFPTIILFKDGEEKARFSGAKTAGFVEQFVDEHMGA